LSSKKCGTTRVKTFADSEDTVEIILGDGRHSWIHCQVPDWNGRRVRRTWEEGANPSYSISDLLVYSTMVSIRGWERNRVASHNQCRERVLRSFESRPDRWRVETPYKNIFDGEGAATKSGNYFGPLVGAKRSLYQHWTNIENVSIWSVEKIG